MWAPNMWYQKDMHRSESGELTSGLTSRATSVSCGLVAKVYMKLPDPPVWIKELVSLTEKKTSKAEKHVLHQEGPHLCGPC